MIFRIFLFISAFLIISFIPFDFIVNKEKDDILYSSVFELTNNDTVWIESTLSGMSLREKCAQLVMPYALGKDTSDYKKNFTRLKKLVVEEKIGGIIFLQGDIENQIALINKLQELSETPLLISADYERGVGMRLEDGVEFPYNMAVGAVNDPNLTYMMGKVTALEGRCVGVHQNFAPLMDVNHDYRNPIINIRAYAADEKLIAAHGTAFIRGMHEGGMLTTAKHFPGHGATDSDSHSEIPMINRTTQELEESDLIPFIESIKIGVSSIMTGHLDVPVYEEKNKIPATLSKKITTDLLQKKLGFDGLVVTDAMNMSAILNNYDQDEAAKLAVQAGNDIILFPYKEIDAIDGIYEAVKTGEISEDRINRSVRKILAAKKWLGLDKNRNVETEITKKVLNDPDHWRLATEIAEKSITLVKDEEKLIPVDPNKFYSVGSIILSDSRLIIDYKIEELIKNNFDYVKTNQLNVKSTKREYNKAYDLATKSKIILLSAFVNVRDNQGHVSMNKSHLELIKKILKLNKPVIIMCFGNPYVLHEFPEAKTYLCAYGEPDVSQIAMIDAVLGNIKICGKLPVSIPETDYKKGFGLELESKGLYFQKENLDSNYNFAHADSIMKKALKDKVFPGGTLLVGQRGKVVFNKSYGKFTYDKAAKVVDEDSMFDLASLSKVLGTTSAAMILVEEGKLDLDEKLIAYLPEFNNNGKDKITIRNLLLHNAGFIPFEAYYRKYSKKEQVINDIANSELKYAVGKTVKYSDLGMITLQLVIESITGVGLDEFLSERVFKPLKMDRTMYNPPMKYWYHCLPTEKDDYWRMMTLKGKVHDETAFLLGGVAGHAGLFSTANDISKLAYTLLNKGRYGEKQILSAEIIDQWTKRQIPGNSRALGWDTNIPGKSSSGTKFSDTSFGHTGFTGTSIWFDKSRELFVILLTNRVHPTRENRKIIKFRPLLHDAIIEAVDYF